MEVGLHTTVHELIDEYPFLLDWLAAHDEHFEKLKNPVFYGTMARIATVEHAASMAGIPAERLLDDVKTEIARRRIVAEETAATTRSALGIAERRVRQEALKGIIRRLHDGASVADVKAEFDALAHDVDSAEIARMEQALIGEGLAVEEVQRLCDVHVSVFKESLDTAEHVDVAENHPVDAYRKENAVAGQIVSAIRTQLDVLAGCESGTAECAEALGGVASGLDDLAQISVHYRRKENQLFPALEHHDVSGPTKVMWALDDDIVGRIKSARTFAAAGDAASVLATLPDTLRMVDDMVYKEEKILLPTALEMLSAEEWTAMAAGDGEIGYAWVEGPMESEISRGAMPSVAPTPGAMAIEPGGEILLPLPTGALTLAQLDLLFRALPFDLTFVDEHDRVQFYSEGERVFPRSPGVIGREVRNCHPPKSVAKVEQILAEFKAGTKDVAEFWIPLAEKFVHIRYFALRDDEGTYRGCLEVVQDATHVRELSGQRRIVDW